MTARAKAEKIEPEAHVVQLLLTDKEAQYLVNVCGSDGGDESYAIYDTLTELGYEITVGYAHLTTKL